jgi:hypothetical protein
MLLLLYAVSFLASIVLDKVQRLIQHVLVTILEARIRNQEGAAEEQHHRHRRRHHLEQYN